MVEGVIIVQQTGGSLRLSIGVSRAPAPTTRLIGILAALLLVVACSAQTSSTPESAAPAIPPAVVADAIRFRQAFGLRADEAWVVLVELDPRSSDEPFGVRLMPNEIAGMEARARNAEAVVPVVVAYGQEHPDDFGGAYIDQRGGGFVVVLVKGDTEIHAGALSRLLHPDAKWAIRQVQYSEAELNALHELVASDLTWFQSAGILLFSVATDVPTNRVEIVYDSLDVSAVDVIRERYESGDMLTLVRDPHPVAFLPRGSLAGRVIDSRGQPVPDLDIMAIGDIANAEPDGGVAYVTGADGVFFIPRLAAMGWEVQALIGVPDDGWKVIGSVHVDVLAGTTTSVVIMVP